jgi:hypothetical protein
MEAFWPIEGTRTKRSAAILTGLEKKRVQITLFIFIIATPSIILAILLYLFPLLSFVFSNFCPYVPMTFLRVYIYTHTLLYS